MRVGPPPPAPVVILSELTMNKQYPFKSFLDRNWWFLLLAFAKIFNQSERGSAFGSLFIDTLFFSGIILVIMFAYWFVRYGRKQSK